MSALTPDIRDLTVPGALVAENTLASLKDDLDFRIDREWRNRIFRAFPKTFAERIAREYEENFIFDGYQSANQQLENHWKRCAKGHIPLNANSYDLEQLAKNHATEMRCTSASLHDDEHAVVQLWPLVQMRGIEPPALNTPNLSPLGILHRLWDQDWWHKKLRKTHARNYEAEAISLGFVHQHAGVYLSEAMFHQYQENKARNRRILSRLMAVNDAEQMFTLEQLIAKGVSNPVNRRNELMCRLAGFETIANDLGHVAEFYTITCPSRMHARLSKSSKANPNYDQTTPKQAQAYLSQVWSRIRAKLGRDNIQIYGFRVAEPHRDGTPHWHLLVFSKADNLPTIRETMRHYALQDNGNEPGAQQHRFKYETIDPKKGSAVGYIAKYISKNIDGYALETEDGMSARTAAERVTAWASIWGIRQFQQFGGAPVTLWRELRKVKTELPEGILQQAFEAADSADWAQFLKLLGGATPKRKDLPIQLEKIESEELNRYGDLKPDQIVGIKTNDQQHIKTRIHQWHILSAKDLVRLYEIRLELAETAAGATYARACARARSNSGGGAAALEFCQ